MTEIPSDVLNHSRQYIEELNRRGFNIISAYIFGSFARGNQTEWSDIDLALVSEKFEGIRFLDRQKLIGIHRNIDLRISPMPFTPSNFVNSMLHDEIVKEGIAVV